MDRWLKFVRPWAASKNVGHNPYNGHEGYMTWEQRLAALGATMDEYCEADFLIKMDQLVAELPN